MTTAEIELLFKKTVEAKDFIKTSGFNRKVVYNYRHRETKLATMLAVLYNLSVIKISLSN